MPNARRSNQLREFEYSMHVNPSEYEQTSVLFKNTQTQLISKQVEIKPHEQKSDNISL